MASNSEDDRGKACCSEDASNVSSDRGTQPALADDGFGRGDDDEVNAHHQRPSTNSTASTSSNAPWARLISIERSFSNIELWKDDTVIGRADVDDSKRISKRHCRIYRDSSGNINIENLSGKGTCVKSFFLRNDEGRAIQHGDEVTFGRHSSGLPAYIFQRLDESSLPGRKRSFENMDNKQLEESRRESKLSKGMDHFKCCICLGLWHDVVSVAPCLHNFCNGCFSVFLKNRKALKCKCPQCRAPALFVTRNYTLNSVVMDFLEEFPSVKRQPDEIAQLDEVAIVKNQFMNIGVANMKMSSDTDDNEDEDNEDEEVEQVGRCAQCTRGDTMQGAFQCGGDTVHLTCSSCFQMMPERSEVDVPQRCAGCHRNFCELYWRSQNLVMPANGRLVSCVATGTLKKINEQSIPNLPVGTFKGNTYEQEVRGNRALHPRAKA